MENTYIAQLRALLETNYQLSTEELSTLIEEYAVTVQTIIDETGSDTEIVKQLGTPEELCLEIAHEYTLLPRSVGDVSNGVKQTTEMPKKSLNWPPIIGFCLFMFFFGAALLFSLFITLFVFSIIPITYLVTAITLGSKLLFVSPIFLLVLILGGISTLLLIILLIDLLVKFSIFIVKKVFSLDIKPAKKRKFFTLPIIITLIIVSTVSNITVFSLPFSNPELRKVLPENMFVFNITLSQKMYTTSKDIPASAVKSISITGNAATITTSESSDNSYHIQVSGRHDSIDSYVKVENGILSFTERDTTNNCFLCVNPFSPSLETIVTIQIPKDAKLDQFSSTLRAGSLTLHNIQTSSLFIHLDAGAVKAQNIVGSTSIVELNAGEFSANTIDMQSAASFKLNAGSIKIETLKADSADFKINAGSAHIKTAEVNTLTKDINAGSLDIETQHTN